MKKILIVLCLMALPLCSCFSGHYTTPIPETDKLIQGLDRGNISIHPTILKEIEADGKRLELKDLLSVSKVFEEIKKSRQAKLLSQRSFQQSFKGQLAAKEKTSTVLDAPDLSKIQTDDPKLSIPSGTADSEPLAAAYHELLYATANTVLGGQTLQNLYNIKDLPKEFKLFVLPVVFSVNPGRITKENYIAEATLELKLPEGAKKDQLRIMAVAPAGFSRFLSNTFTEYYKTALGLALQAQFKIAAAAGQYTSLTEDLDNLVEIVRRRDFQVSIVEGNKLIFRYMGLKGVKKNIRLQNATFNAEILVIANPDQMKKISGSNGTKSESLNTFRSNIYSYSVGGKGKGGVFIHPAAQNPVSGGSEVSTPSEQRTLNYNITTCFVPYYPFADSWGWSVSVEKKEFEEIYAETSKGEMFVYFKPENISIEISKILLRNLNPEKPVSGAKFDYELVLSGSGLDAIFKTNSKIDREKKKLAKAINDNATEITKLNSNISNAEKDLNRANSAQNNAKKEKSKKILAELKKKKKTLEDKLKALQNELSQKKYKFRLLFDIFSEEGQKIAKGIKVNKDNPPSSNFLLLPVTKLDKALPKKIHFWIHVEKYEEANANNKTNRVLGEYRITLNKKDDDDKESAVIKRVVARLNNYNVVIDVTITNKEDVDQFHGFKINGESILYSPPMVQLKDASGKKTKDYRAVFTHHVSVNTKLTKYFFTIELISKNGKSTSRQVVEATR